MRGTFSILGAWFILLAAAPTLPAQAAPCSIRGTVIDENDVHVNGAVVVLRARSKSLTRFVPTTETNEEGRFAFPILSCGSYKVYAMKESAGYPNTYFPFYGSGASEAVVLSAAVPSASVRIRLGPIAGILTGNVYDAVSGAPIKANFLIRRARSPEVGYGTSQWTHYRVLLPPSTPVNAEVSAPGYRAAHLVGLSIASGEVRELDIKLTPEGKRYYIDARGPIGGRRINPSTVEMARKECPECVLQKPPLRVSMALSDGPLKSGAKVPVWFTITNVGVNSLLLPVSTSPAGIATPDSPTDHKFSELVIAVQADSKNAGPTLDTPFALYGRSDAPGTLRSLGRNESLVVRADLGLRIYDHGTPLAIGFHSLNAAVDLENVTVEIARKRHVETRVVVAHAESPLLGYKIAPQE